MYTKYADEIQPNEYIKVPLGTILGIDETLKVCLDLDVDEGLWREDKDSEWEVWE